LGNDPSYTSDFNSAIDRWNHFLIPLTESCQTPLVKLPGCGYTSAAKFALGDRSHGAPDADLCLRP
jgi:hypothetical protein